MNTPPARVERRRERRMVLEGTLPIARLDAGDGLSPTAEAMALDISIGGIRVRTHATLAVGDEAVIQLSTGSGQSGLVGVVVVHADAAEASTGRILGMRYIPLPRRVIRAVLIGPGGELVDLRRRGPRTLRATA
ncbi:MAG: PilZ domain-containing protein [Planctomycetota bacterium]|nr:PilZ domain-containing protein [Planctomycetota bacterium]